MLTQFKNLETRSVKEGQNQLDRVMKSRMKHLRNMSQKEAVEKPEQESQYNLMRK